MEIEHDLVVDEFTESGALIPSDPIGWPEDEDQAPAGWELCWSIGRWEEADPVTADVFVEAETWHVLINFVALGISSWILCRRRLAFLLFVRDWLGPLAESNRAAIVSAFGDALNDFLEEASFVWDQVAEGASERLAVRRNGSRKPVPRSPRLPRERNRKPETKSSRTDSSR